VKHEANQEQAATSKRDAFALQIYYRCVRREMSITYADFEKACEALQERWEKFGGNTNWLEVKLHYQV
jgi:hypothetical protein